VRVACQLMCSDEAECTHPARPGVGAGAEGGPLHFSHHQGAVAPLPNDTPLGISHGWRCSAGAWNKCRPLEIPPTVSLDGLAAWVGGCGARQMAEMIHLSFEWEVVPTQITLAGIKDSIRTRHGGTLLDIQLYKDLVRPHPPLCLCPETQTRCVSLRQLMERQQRPPADPKGLPGVAPASVPCCSCYHPSAAAAASCAWHR
jgi:hypothetical protein